MEAWALRESLRDVAKIQDDLKGRPEMLSRFNRVLDRINQASFHQKNIEDEAGDATAYLAQARVGLDKTERPMSLLLEDTTAIDLSEAGRTVQKFYHGLDGGLDQTWRHCLEIQGDYPTHSIELHLQSAQEMLQKLQLDV